MIIKPNVQRIRIHKWLEGIGGGTPSTNILSNLPAPVATEILEKAQLTRGEEDLLANYRSDTEWCLLTSQRLIWFQDNVLGALPWGRIVGAQQPPLLAAQIIRGDLTKDEITELEIFDDSANKHTLRLEAGEPYYIIWSAILAFGNHTRRPDPIPL